jgi:hypothetical protein
MNTWMSEALSKLKTYLEEKNRNSANAKENPHSLVFTTGAWPLAVRNSFLSALKKTNVRIQAN